jgi:predicted nucleotidyltransferase
LRTWSRGTGWISGRWLWRPPARNDRFGDGTSCRPSARRDRHQVITILKRHERELRALGMEHLSVFGSVARDTGTETSDVDVAVSLKPGPRGLYQLARLETVQVRLSELLCRPRRCHRGAGPVATSSGCHRARPRPRVPGESCKRMATKRHAGRFSIFSITWRLSGDSRPALTRGPSRETSSSSRRWNAA